MWFTISYLLWLFVCLLRPECGVDPIADVEGVAGEGREVLKQIHVGISHFDCLIQLLVVCSVLQYHL